MGLFDFFKSKEIPKHKSTLEQLNQVSNLEAREYALLSLDEKEKKTELNQIINELESLASQDCLEALVELGKLYYYGKYLKDDDDVAINYFLKAYELGSDIACLYLSHIYYAHSQDSLVEQYGKRAVALGNKLGNYFMGNYYFTGEYYGETDYSKAKYYYDLALKEKNKDHFDKVEVYTIIQICEQLCALAIELGYVSEDEYFTHAKTLEQFNSTDAEKHLCSAYLFGLGTAQNIEKAKEMVARSFAKDYEYAEKLKELLINALVEKSNTQDSILAKAKASNHEFNKIRIISPADIMNDFNAWLSKESAKIEVEKQHQAELEKQYEKAKMRGTITNNPNGPGKLFTDNYGKTYVLDKYDSDTGMGSFKDGRTDIVVAPKKY